MEGRPDRIRLGYSPDSWYRASFANFVFKNIALSDTDITASFQTSQPTSNAKPGDLNGDGKVDMSDYNLLVANFGKTGSAGFSPADIDKNGKVDVFDYNELVANFRK